MELVDDFIEFMDFCTDPMAFCIYASKLLEENGYVHVQENNLPKELPKKGYLIRSHKSFIAYNAAWFKGAVVTGAHSDSPILKLKNNIEKTTDLYHLLNTANYTGGLSHSTFGRDLKLKGLVYYLENGTLQTKYIDSKRPIGFIPFPEVSLMDKFSLTPEFNRDNNMRIVVGTKGTTPVYEYLAGLAEIPVDSIVSTDLYLADINKAKVDGEFLTSARLDNLVSSYCSLKAFIESEPKDTLNMICVFDNEENGSHTLNGALGDFFERTLRFITSRSNVNLEVLKRNSLIISADANHGSHPNYAGLYEKNHQPGLGQGLMMRGTGQNTTSLSFRGIITMKEASKLANQQITVTAKRNGRGSGGTIGPKMEFLNGMPVIDVGSPMLGMHSYRETMCYKDLKAQLDIIKYTYLNYADILARMDGNN
ncbi:Clan MH, family M18, aspartyl aminopeptidase-like metallopeptidase [Trichomonas vaginalis G3]|uniref:aspartyl aminopeptidase n=1 Tax=Trichomonas vaginalis (strain ATCC PRA-98 / G3) TaxID=412133 RepID=A2EUN4_TRIV3|nr:aminopeptidase protein [Trichomonas vaginalis G3]EAY03622.1 Clan MH, family M18, aspartyl aminopeptidase-like metallopeptidase [Trichomonas vaginalis G3]KAI5524717.1 aminopeptidase protein [Trichomonas vaginalis G3]|eukprot:XP_001315845.1 Clan MH, family M18, aspartyl aminopeptidase-like metallopeptidase [Trichomonas vaginalis G3]